MRDGNALRLSTAPLVTLVIAALVAAPCNTAGATALSRTDGGARRRTTGPVPMISVHDPVGDAASPHGDITGAGFAQNASQLSFGMTVASATDPTHDPKWRNGQALAAWWLDTNNDETPEYVVGLLPGPHGGPIALMASLSNLKLCAGDASFVPHSGYRATFPKTCLRPGLWFRFQAAMTYPRVSNERHPSIDVTPNNAWSPAQVTTQVAGQSGYWMLSGDGNVHAFGAGQGFSGSARGAAAIAPRKDGTGYWTVDLAGQVYAYGNARYFGGSPPLRPGEYISVISATPTSSGYWLFSNKGRAFPFGDGDSYGDMSGTQLNGPIVASAATPSGHGYYMVGSDGGIFTFGDAHFRGSTGALRLSKAVVGIAPTPDGHGYWLVASDGGVFAFGAPFRGSMGTRPLNSPVEGIAVYGNGYLLAASDGGVFDFSNKRFAGSLTNHPQAAPIIGVAAFAT